MVAVQDGRGCSGGTSSAFTVLHKFAADVLSEGNASSPPLLCLFRRDGMTELQDGGGPGARDPSLPGIITARPGPSAGVFIASSPQMCAGCFYFILFYLNDLWT